MNFDRFAKTIDARVRKTLTDETVASEMALGFAAWRRGDLEARLGALGAGAVIVERDRVTQVELNDLGILAATDAVIRILSERR